MEEMRKRCSMSEGKPIFRDVKPADDYTWEVVAMAMVMKTSCVVLAGWREMRKTKWQIEGDEREDGMAEKERTTAQRGRSRLWRKKKRGGSRPAVLFPGKYYLLI